MTNKQEIEMPFTMKSASELVAPAPVRLALMEALTGVSDEQVASVLAVTLRDWTERNHGSLNPEQRAELREITMAIATLADRLGEQYVAPAPEKSWFGRVFWGS
jgi:hypothetical protein